MAAPTPTAIDAPLPLTVKRQYSFTDFSQNNPTTPPAGNRMDAEYDRINVALNSVINFCSEVKQLAPALTATSTVVGADPTDLELDYAYLTQAWAEHMPDTIPPNILAAMNITGDHWSSRWWAARAAQIVTSAKGSFTAVGDTPPPAPKVGDGWWDSGTEPGGGQLYIWYDDGSSMQWVPATNLLAGPQGPAGVPGAPGTNANVTGLTSGQLAVAGSATSIVSSVPYGTSGVSTVVQTAPTGTLLPAVLPAYTGDVTSPPGSTVNTLSVVNPNVGTFQGLTLDAKGRVTAATNQGFATTAQLGNYLPLTGGAVAGNLSVSGNVGIGTTAPRANLDVSGLVAATTQVIAQTTGSSGGVALVTGSTTSTGYVGWYAPSTTLGGGTLTSYLGQDTSGSLTLHLTSTFNVAGGDVRIGPGPFAGTSLFTVAGPGPSWPYDPPAVFQNLHNTAGDNGIYVGTGPNSADTTSHLIQFYDSSITTVQGAIMRAGAASVSYATTSDARLKEDIVDSKTGLQALMALQVRDYRYPGDDRIQQGLVAQDVAKIYPIAVHAGGDDPVKEPWMLDYGRLTPLLIKGFQEQQEHIARLEKKLAALQDGAWRR